MKNKSLNIFGKLFIFFMFVFTANSCFSQPAVDWCNLQYPPSDTIIVGAAYNVYAQVYEPGITEGAGQGAGISAWIGYHTENTDPSTWTNWVEATYNTDAGNNDEYMAEIGSTLPYGTYYYASRFIISGGNYQYGGINGFWDGINNISGVLLVSQLAVDWCNLQYPPSDTIIVGAAYNVYAQVYEPGITEGAGQGAGISAWIGYHTENTDPSTWTNWVEATYNTDAGNNDEYMAEIGSTLPYGTYYYASRFIISGGNYQYGGINGFWDGINNISGVLLVTDDLTIIINSFSDVNIYPNPVKSILNISFGCHSNNIKLTILNILGQEMFSKNFNNGVPKQSFDISILHSGTYIIKIQNNEQMINKPLIIQ